VKRRTRLAIAGSLLSVTLALTACSGGGSTGGGDAAGEPVDGGDLVYATDVQPAAGGLDPYLTSAFASENVLVQIYETLFVKDADGEIQPNLAEDYTQVDDLTLEVTLRDDVVFSDGTPLTAEDVKFSFDTMMVAGTPQAALIRGLASTEVVDDTTVRFTFATPNGAFLNVISARGNAYIVNQAWYESTSADDRQRSALGTGPFVLDDWQDNVAVSLSKNTEYWQEGLPHVDTLTFEILADETARQSALRQGSAQAGWLRDPSLASQLEGEGFTRGQNAATRNLYLAVNAQNGGPLADVRVRQALSMAMDRDEILSLGGGGNGEVSLAVAAGDPVGVAPDEDTPNYSQDIEGAQELLAEAGYPDGVTIGLTYASDASFAIDVPAYEVMQEQVAEAGITLELNGTAWADLVSAYVGGTFGDDLTAVPGTYRPDPTAYLTAFLAPGVATNKVTAEGDPGVAELGALFEATDPAERQAQLEELLDTVAENAYTYVLYASPQRYEVWSDELQGYEVDPYTYRSNLKDAWLQ
jgi:peptide/nickel transport system substrate-binding protein